MTTTAEWPQDAIEYENTIAAAEPAVRLLLRESDFFRRAIVNCFVCGQKFSGFQTAAITRCFTCAIRDGMLSDDPNQRKAIWLEVLDAKDMKLTYQTKVTIAKHRSRK